jgi:hypothetical protein
MELMGLVPGETNEYCNETLEGKLNSIAESNSGHPKHEG